MEGLSRTDSRYLKLFTEEHSILKADSQLMNDYKLKESEERDLFFFLSAALRDSQEKERTRIERIKYLSYGLSIICTALGIISAYLVNYFRNTHINEILSYNKVQFKSTQDSLESLKNSQQINQIKLNENFDKLNETLKNLIPNPRKDVNVKQDDVKQTVAESNKTKLDLIRVHPYLLSLASVICFIVLSSK